MQVSDKHSFLTQTNWPSLLGRMVNLPIAAIADASPRALFRTILQLTKLKHRDTPSNFAQLDHNTTKPLSIRYLDGNVASTPHFSSTCDRISNMTVSSLCDHRN